MKIAYCVYGVDDHTIYRTEFYRQDLEILRSLGHDVDIVHSPLRLRGYDLAVVWWWNYMALWGPAAKLMRLPLLVTGVYDPLKVREWPWWKRTTLKFGSRFGDLNVLISNFELHEIGNLAAFRKGSERLSLLVVDTDTYRPGPPGVRRDEPFTVFNVAWQRLTNAKRKMIFELLEAFTRLHREFPDTRLTLAGPPEDGGAVLEARARELGVRDAVDFPGELTLEQKIAEMQRCSLYCQVSEYEGFGLATAEAMACGAPVLVSRVGAVPEVVGDAGFYANEVSVDGIWRGLRERYLDREGTRAMAARARERVERHLSRARRAADFRGYIEELTGKS